MTKHVEMFAALAPEETYAGHVDQNVDQKNEKRVQRPQQSEGIDWGQRHAQRQAAHHAKHTQSRDRANWGVTLSVRPGDPTWQQAIASHRVDDSRPTVDNSHCRAKEREH